MIYRKEIITTAGTLACAIGIGFFMQSSQSTPPEAYEGVPLINADAAVLDVQEIFLTSAEIPEPAAPTSDDDSDNIVLAAAQDIPAAEPQAALQIAAVTPDVMQPAPQAVPLEPTCDIT